MDLELRGKMPGLSPSNLGRRELRAQEVFIKICKCMNLHLRNLVVFLLVVSVKISLLFLKIY
jgi:hypothetical protein